MVNENFSPLTLLDLYLARPIGPNIQDLIPTIQIIISQIPPEQIQQMFGHQINIAPLLSKYGRFWINEDKLYYRHPQGYDISVNEIEVGKSLSQNGLIARINGQVIPIIALEQLRILIKHFGKNTIYAELYDKINKYHRDIKMAINDFYDS